jgi:hypothetical protein
LRAKRRVGFITFAIQNIEQVNKIYRKEKFEDEMAHLVKWQKGVPSKQIFMKKAER